MWVKDYPGLSKSTVKGSRLETHIQVVEYRLNRLDELVFIAMSKTKTIAY